MIINQPHFNQFDYINRLLISFANLKVIIFIIFFFINALVFIYLGAVVHKNGYHHKLINEIKRLQRIPVNFVKGIGAEPEYVIIDIKHKHFQKLAYKREMAFNIGNLITCDDDFVPGKITIGGKTAKIKIRLKGDGVEHLYNDKWSFRVRVKDEETILGMKQFSLQHPEQRYYMGEWLFHNILKTEDVISLRYKFVSLSLNGKNLGIYSLEEHFEKRLIEHNQRREGPIVKFDESLWWAERLLVKGYMRDRLMPGAGDYYSLPVDAFQTKKTLKKPNLYKNFIQAQYLLNSFRNEELAASKVFDIKKLGFFLALCDVFGEQHSIHTNQFRFYYNPVTSLLEPIPYDMNAGRPDNKLYKILGVWTHEDHNNDSGGGRAFVLSSLFKDYDLWNYYVKSLIKISRPDYFKNIFKSLNNEWKKNISILYKEFPAYYFSKKFLYQNQDYIDKILNPVKGLHAYFQKGQNQNIVLSVGNIQQIPIEILSLSYKKSHFFKPSKTIYLPSRISKPASYHNITFISHDKTDFSNKFIADLKINYKLVGQNKIRQADIFPWPLIDKRDLTNNDFIREKTNLNIFDFIVCNETKKQIYFKSGEWNLKKNLIIPSGYSVFAENKFKLHLYNSAKILSYSSLIFNANKNDPIIIDSPDSSGQGIIVINASKSLFNYVHFINLSAPSQGAWSLTGAVSFYESPVKITNCFFSNNRSEDALNIIRSNFIINSTTFYNIFSDAFDGDFTKGFITNSVFTKTKNDAIDVSGSNIEINDVHIKLAGDKGISVGENSTIIVNNSDIQHSEIAVASKDNSELTMTNSNISNSKVGFAVYQKKSEYGPASIRINGTSMANVDLPYLNEMGSFLTVDKKVIAATKENVKDILYGNIYGTKTAK